MFLKGPKKLQQNLKPNMTTELFYAHILSMNRGSLHIRSFRHIHLSVFARNAMQCNARKQNTTQYNLVQLVHLPGSLNSFGSLGSPGWFTWLVYFVHLIHLPSSPGSSGSLGWFHLVQLAVPLVHLVHLAGSIGSPGLLKKPSASG